MLMRITGTRNGIGDDYVMPGDLIAGGESVLGGALATVGAGTWTAGLIGNGILYRTGPVAGYADTTDTATNILAALAGNGSGAEALAGTTFRMRFINTVAFAMTLTLGTGIVTGLGTLNVAASLWREYLWTILNTTPSQIINCGTTNASAVVTFNFPPGMTSYPIGSDPRAVNITPGATVSGTGISAGTTVLGVTQGQGGITGVTLSANATATNAAVALTFGPTMRLDSLGSGTL